MQEAIREDTELPLPAVAFLPSSPFRADEAATDTQATTQTPALIVQHGEAHLAWVKPGASSPETLTIKAALTVGMLVAFQMFASRLSQPVMRLVGPSGCGKSTLAKLLQGVYFAQEGQIRIDGRDIRTLAANELRAYFGVVPQETVLFSGTLYDNPIMAHPHAHFEDVIAACQAAEIHEFIEGLPNGYQTEIGERGTGLSGGQHQRVAIARALLKRPKLLIFDEAISNLDQHTAEHFAQTINRLKGKVTMIFITHRVPKGLQVDEVVNMAGHTMQMSLMKEEL